MPNHITTICTVSGSDSDVKSFRELMFETQPDESISFEFRKIIPMPASVEAVVERGGLDGIITILLRGPGCVEAWQDLQRGKPEEIGPWKGLFGFETGEIERRIETAYPGLIELARRKCLSFGETGYWGWYDWSIANWGTKWGAYGFVIQCEEPLVFKFETAWDFPLPVFEAIAARFPDLKFRCTTFDEGWNFAGDGYFNPGADESPWEKLTATAELYEAVYGHPPEPDEEEEEAE